MINSDLFLFILSTYILSTCYFTVVVTPTFYDVDPKPPVKFIVNSLFIL